MTQFGMNMPGGQAQRRPSMDVYTGLLFLAVLALVAACGFLWIQGSKVGKDGKWWEMQDPNSITLRQAAG